MVDFDYANQSTPAASRLPTKGGKPAIADLKTAISSSSASAKYSAKFMHQATKNDLIYVCRLEGISVPGLPGV